MIEFTLIPGEIKHIAESVTNFTEKVKAALQSNTAIEIEALVNSLIPQAAGLETEVLALCDAAIKTCQAIEASDWSGVTGRLQRLVTDTTHLLSGQKHTLSNVLIWCEAVIRDILDDPPSTS